MEIIIPYAFCIVSSFIMGFGNLSEGAWFTWKVQATLSFIAIGLSVGSCIAVAIAGAWLHIAGIIFSFVFFSWLGAKVMLKIRNH